MALALIKVGSHKTMFTANKVADQIRPPEWGRSHNFARGAIAPSAETPMPQAARAEAPEAVSETNNSAKIRPAGKINRDHLPQNVVAMSFKDVVDTLNPLQHLPGIGDLYRAATGDQPSGMARILGGFAFGGFGGGIMAFADATHAESHNGNGIAETMVATILGEENATTSPTMLAETTPAPVTKLAEATPAQTAHTTQPTPVAVQAARQQPADYLPPLPPKNLGNKLDSAGISMLLQEKARGSAMEGMKQIEGLADIAANARIGNVGSAAETQKSFPELMNAGLDKYRRNSAQRSTAMPTYVPPLQRF
jgi:hypothetical protein